MDEGDKKRIEDDFQNITKLSPADTRELIEDLADENLKIKPLLHYYEYISKFKPLTITTDKLTMFENNNNSSSFENNVRSVGKGEYGETFLGSKSGRVFKRITATFFDLIELNAFCRNILVESFIQTVVSTDPSEFTKNICKIKGVFKDKVNSENIVFFDIVDRRDKNYYVKLSTLKPLVYKELHDMFLDAGATIQEIYLSDESNSYIIILTAPIAEAIIKKLTYDNKISTFTGLEVGRHNNKKITVSLYIELEKLDTTFDKYIYDNNTAVAFECGIHKCITYSNFKDKYLLPLASTLEYFNKKYNFYHGDLHTGNIMFSGNTLKIIDMGKACVTYNKKTYSADISTGCKSTDLGIFLVCILEDADKIYNKVLSKLTSTTIQNLLKVKTDDNEYDIWELVKEKVQHYTRVYGRGTRIAHGMYSWTSPWNKYPDKLLLDVILSITPEYIMEKLNSVKIHGIAARRGGSRHNRKRRRNITRKTYPSAR